MKPPIPNVVSSCGSGSSGGNVIVLIVVAIIIVAAVSYALKKEKQKYAFWV